MGVSSYGSYGYGDAGFYVTLSDGAATDIHSYGGNAVFLSAGPSAFLLHKIGITPGIFCGEF